MSLNPYDECEIGYGKPPKSTQFQKGRSGNSNGRPPASKDAVEAMAQVLNELIPVTWSSGRKTRAPGGKALAEQLIIQALAGDLTAIRQVVHYALKLRGVGLMAAPIHVINALPDDEPADLDDCDGISKTSVDIQTSPDPEIVHAVGYKQPPKHSQFRPGQSGNLRGRSPRPANFHEALAQGLQRKRKIKNGGRSRSVSTLYAILLVLRNKAFSGFSGATRLIARIEEKSTIMKKQHPQELIFHYQGMDPKDSGE